MGNLGFFFMGVSVAFFISMCVLICFDKDITYKGKIKLKQGDNINSDIFNNSSEKENKEFILKRLLKREN